MKLTPEQDKLIRLIVKGRGEDGWAKVHPMWFRAINKLIRSIVKGRGEDGWAKVHPMWFRAIKLFSPEALVVLEDDKDGWGRARLTEEGETVYNAMRVIN